MYFATGTRLDVVNSYRLNQDDEIICLLILISCTSNWLSFDLSMKLVNYIHDDVEGYIAY